ncbi:MAG: AAA family ATPase [bacterium]
MNKSFLKTTLNPLYKNKKTFGIFLITGLICGLIYTDKFYKPSYETVSKLLVKSSNSLVNDINIINSNDLRMNVWNSIKNNYKIKLSDKIGMKKLEQSVIVDNLNNSNIIVIRSYWKNPKISLSIANEIINEYKKHNFNRSEITVIEKPNTINKLNRLIKLNYILNFLLLSALLGWICITIKNLLNDTCADILELQNIIKAPVLGTIPWLDKDTYKAPNSLVIENSLASFYALAYQKIITSLKIHSANKKSKAIAFTSAEYSKNRSTILQNIAMSLNKGGRSVIVIDADLRTPSIHTEFGLAGDEKFHIKSLLSVITDSITNDSEFDPKYIYPFIQKVPSTPNLYVLTGNNTITDPSQYLFSPAFNYLIKELKKRYDFVLIDTPPILAVPDAITIGSSIDGLILITGLNIQKSTLKQLKNIFKEHQISLLGVITREIQKKEASSENEYIKQMIERMIPQTINEKAQKED